MFAKRRKQYISFQKRYASIKLQFLSLRKEMVAFFSGKIVENRVAFYRVHVS